MYSEDAKAIRDRMMDKIPSDVDKSEGSFVWDNINPVSEELAESRLQLDEVLKRVFAISAAESGYADEVKKRAAEFGVYQKQGTKASGNVKFTGAEGTVISSGSPVQTDSELQYITKSEAIIGVNGTVTADIEAAEIGSKYNVPAGTINTIPIQIVGVVSVTNEEPISGGTNEETIEDLLNRLLLKVQLPATSGNIHHYKLWALEVNGVGDAKVVPEWDGPGTVKVVLIDSNKRTVTEEIRLAAYNNIENQRPIGATVTVEGAVEVPINVSATLQLAPGADINTVKAQIEEGLTEYLKSLAFVDPLVRYTRIANILLDIPPIIDYSNLLVNSGPSNIPILDGSVAVPGTVSISEA